MHTLKNGIKHQKNGIKSYTKFEARLSATASTLKSVASKDIMVCKVCHRDKWTSLNTKRWYPDMSNTLY